MFILYACYTSRKSLHIIFKYRETNDNFIIIFYFLSMFSKLSFNSLIFLEYYGKVNVSVLPAFINLDGHLYCEWLQNN